MRIFVFIFLTQLFIYTSSSFAIEEIIKNYRGVRSVGMGSVLTTTGDYSEALFGNPARHTEAEDWKISLVDTFAEANTNFFLNLSQVLKMRSATGNTILTSGARFYGRNEHLRVQNISGYYHPKFFKDLAVAGGFLFSSQNNLFIRYTSDVELQTVFDVGPTLGAAYSFFNRHLSVGMNLRFLYRLGSDQTIRKADLLGGSKRLHPSSSSGHQGFGIDGDLGTYLHFPWHPSWISFNLGGSINNVLSSNYQLIRYPVYPDPGSAPPRNDRTYNVGLRLDFPDFLFFDSPLLAIEYSDIGATSKFMTWSKQIHLGGEFRFLRNYFAARLGINQGYFTAGFGVYLPVLKLDFATYSEEIGSNAGMIEDRRFVARLALEI